MNCKNITLCLMIMGVFVSHAQAGEANTGFKRVTAVQINPEVGGKENDHYIKLWLQDVSGSWYYRSSSTGEIALIESLALTAMSTGRSLKIIYDDSQTGTNREIGSIVIR